MPRVPGRASRDRFRDDQHLTGRFAAYAALALVVAAAATFVLVRGEAIHRAERTGLYHTKFVADAIVRDRIAATDLLAPVSGARRRELDALLHRGLLAGGGVRANLYTREGRVAYSTDPSLIGRTPDDLDRIAAARSGRLVSEVTRLGEEDGARGGIKVLEAYVPVRIGTAQGVFELYLDYAPIATSAQQMFVPMAGLIAAILLALYLSFFPILRRATARLRRQMQHIEHQALHDALTGLPNRVLLHDRLEQAIRHARRHGSTVAVMVMDLDRFKEINDTLGHHSGDRLLVEVGGNLAAAVRDSDSVARLGGDEFAIVAPAIDGGDGAIALAERALDALRRPHEIAGVEIDVDASIGIALYPEHGRDVDTLIRRADIAMYASKERGAPTVYAPEADHHTAERLALVAQLRRAIAEREITVYYQPQADVRTAQVRSVEALVRWEHPEHGLLPPDRFIPLAENTGLIRALTSHVLDTALEQCRRWRDDGIDLGVAVNISGRDLLDLRLPEEVAGLLGKWGVDASRLELEITENTVLTDPARARAVLSALSELGVRLAIDDFGSGNSSLGYLKRLPVDVLKIDKSFVLQMDHNDDDAVIVRSTIDLGHNLGLRVVAEGVETADAWSRLSALGCDIAQGYYLSRPVPASAIPSLLQAGQPDVDAPAAA